MNGMATENPYNKTRVMMDEGHNVAQAAVAMNNHFRCVSNDTGSFFFLNITGNQFWSNFPKNDHVRTLPIKRQGKKMTFE